MNRYIVIIFISVLSIFSGCSVVGSRDVFVPIDGSEWEKRKLSSRVSYRYECKEFSIYLDEVLVVEKTHAFGPILPVIPSGKVDDQSEDVLFITITMFGYVPNRIYDKDDFNITVSSLDQKLHLQSDSLHKTKEEFSNEKDSLWVQYQLYNWYAEKRGEFKELSVLLNTPFPQCNPSTLHLKRSKRGDFEFIWSPGA